MYSAVIDIETTDLAAVSGIVTCVCIRPTQTRRTRTYHVGMYYQPYEASEGFLAREETELLKAVIEELGKYHILIGHNLIRFDIPYLRSRAFIRGLEWTLYPMIYDTLVAFKRTRYLTRMNGFGKPTASLAHVADFANIKQEKSPIFPRAWLEQLWGNEIERIEATRKVAEHCQADVRMNDAVFEFLWAADLRAAMKRAI